MRSKSLILSENITPFVLYSGILLGTFLIVITLFILALTVDFSPRTRLERVNLPKATEVLDDKLPPKERVLINIVHFPPRGERCTKLKYDSKTGLLVRPCQDKTHWKVRIYNRDIRVKDLTRFLKLQGDADREPPHPSGELGLSNIPVMIRADAGAPWKLVKRVLSAAKQAGFWKIELGASKPPYSLNQ